MSRTKKAVRNSMVGLITQLLTLILSFVMASVFVKTLGGEYLGANGLFSNVIAILSFSELGVGAAIAYSLYQPLHDGDMTRIAAIMAFFAKVYMCVGLLIIALSICILPFLDMFVKGNMIPNMGLYFFLFACNTAVSYFLSYKRTLLIADQKSYVTDTNNLWSKLLVAVFQIGFLFFHNYLGFLIVQIVGTVVANLLINRKANQLYHDVFALKNTRMSASDLAIIKKSTMGIMGQKFGSIVVRDTNNLLVSSFAGLFITGIFTSYMTIFNGIQMIISQALNALIASIGNLTADNNSERLHTWLKRHIFLTWTIAYFSAVYLLSLITPFVRIWLGDNYRFSFLITLFLVLNFYISQTRMTFLSFVQAQGLFVKMGIKSMVEAVLNLILCLVFLFILKMGVLGIILGTTSVHILLNIWFEPRLVYKDGFGKRVPAGYFAVYGLKLTYTFGVGVLIYICAEMIFGSGILDFVGRTLFTTCVSIAMYLLVTIKNDAFIFYWNYLKKNLIHKGMGLIKKENI
ncbi:lipopolysaccharide biosynthesis protein [Weissella cibaria]|uniref:Uncharacterized protein n=1 Tax=Weissella cibaria TaxID=137591 RepID=A0A2S1KU92_9LACO|nr:hypothetical protein [Weissella cibaria]AWF96586.1 hypothetical protein B6254_2235 [Weissella cibaria]